MCARCAQRVLSLARHAGAFVPPNGGAPAFANIAAALVNFPNLPHCIRLYLRRRKLKPTQRFSKVLSKTNAVLAHVAQLVLRSVTGTKPPLLGLRVAPKLDSIVFSTLIPIFGLLYETKFGPQVILTFG